jgi:hypothetical protein
MYNNGIQFEFYRNRCELEAGRVEMRLLKHMSKTGSAWVDTALLQLGDLLISTGTKIKHSARPLARLSQETL